MNFNLVVSVTQYSCRVLRLHAASETAASANVTIYIGLVPVFVDVDQTALKLKATFYLENYIVLRFLPCISWTLIYRYRIKNSWHAGWRNEVWALEVLVVYKGCLQRKC